MKCWSIVAVALLLLLPSAASAASVLDEEASVKFFYPLVTRRPVIERELEFKFEHDRGDEGRESEIAAALEYALTPWWQIEIEFPLVILSPRQGSSQAGIGDIEVDNKFMLFTSSEHRAAVAAGFELKLPSGSERRGTGGEFAIEPYITAGIGFGPFEILASVAWERHLEAHIESRHHEQELSANVALGWLLGRSFVALLEVNTVTSLEGEDDPGLAHHTQVYLTPGFNVRVAPGTTFRAGVMLPVTKAREFDYGIRAGLTWEF